MICCHSGPRRIIRASQRVHPTNGDPEQSSLKWGDPDFNSGRIGSTSGPGLKAIRGHARSTVSVTPDAPWLRVCWQEQAGLHSPRETLGGSLLCLCLCLAALQTVASGRHLQIKNILNNSCENLCLFTFVIEPGIMMAGVGHSG